jgi:lipoprotein NlpI
VGNFEAAAESFLRATELDHDAYSVIWRYLARQHGGANGEAELAANAERLKSKDWPYPVIEMYLGQRLPGAALSAAHRPEDRCEAQFYIGEWYMFRGDRVAAAAAFRDAAATCPKDFNEYAGALAELNRLSL